MNREQKLSAAVALLEKTAAVLEQHANALHQAAEHLNDGFSPTTTGNDRSTPTFEPDPPLSRKQTAEALGLADPDTVTAMWDRNDLPYVLIGKRRFTPAAAIREKV